MSSRSAPDAFRLAHFEELQRRVNARLRKLAPRHMEKQLKYGWLYGAWGSVPSRVMFVCENPSLEGCEAAHNKMPADERDGNMQWIGDFRAKRFREALCRAGLKKAPADSDEGWGCYITNVVKEVAVAGEYGSLSPAQKAKKAEQWADILAWEWREMAPEHVFAVGGASHYVLRRLQRRKLIPERPEIHKIHHYSARGNTDELVDTICREVKEFL